MSDLKPCPFCGRPDACVRTNQHDYPLVQCDSCHASTPAYKIEPAAIAAWNRRAAPEPAPDTTLGDAGETADLIQRQVTALRSIGYTVTAPADAPAQGDRERAEIIVDRVPDFLDSRAPTGSRNAALDFVEQIIAAVRAEERERCGKIIDNARDMLGIVSAATLAAAIRGEP